MTTCLRGQELQTGLVVPHITIHNNSINIWRCDLRTYSSQLQEYHKPISCTSSPLLHLPFFKIKKIKLKLLTSIFSQPDGPPVQGAGMQRTVSTDKNPCIRANKMATFLPRAVMISDFSCYISASRHCLTVGAWVARRALPSTACSSRHMHGGQSIQLS